MATRTTTKNLGVLIKGLGDTAKKAQRDAVFNATRYTINVIENQMHKDLGGKNYFTNMNYKPGHAGYAEAKVKKLYLWYNVKGTNNPTALITAHGPWGILEYGADPHPMTPNLRIRQRQKGMTKLQKRQDNARIAFGGRGAMSGVRPLGNRKTGFGPVYRVKHPGVKPKKTFSRGLEKATPTAEKIAFSLIQAPIIRYTRMQFGGGSIYQIVGDPGIYTPGKVLDL